MSKQTIPFYYIVGWSDENKYYIGSRYAKGCNPSDLGTKYFTSSKVVKAKWKEKEPDIVQVLMTFDTREQALEWESTALTNFNVPQNPMFLNRTNGRKNFCITEEGKAKWRAKLNGRKLSEETKKKISAANKGRKRADIPWNKGMRKVKPEKIKKERQPLSLEARKQISEKLKGRKLSEETIAKRIATLLKSPRTVTKETRAKMSAAHKGKTHSVEARAKMSESARNRKKKQ